MTTAALRAQVETLAKAYDELETMPLKYGRRLIALLESSPDEALELLYERRVKFCWAIARRILEERRAEK